MENDTKVAHASPGYKTDKHGPPSSNTGRKQFSYKWAILIACSIFGVVSFGIRFSFGVFFEPLETEFDLTRTATSGIFSLFLGLTAVSAVLFGWVLDRYGPKVVVLLMGSIAGLALLLTSQANSLWHIFITYSLLLAIGTGATNNVITATISAWFARRRGLALGIGTSGIGLGTMIVAPLSGALISSYGWRTSYFILALMAFLIIIPCALFLKRRPSESATLSTDKLPVAKHRYYSMPTQFSLSQILTTKSFWFFLLVWFFEAFCIFIILAHIVRHAIDLDIAPIEAVTVLSLIGGMGVVGRLLMGRISDSIGRKKSCMICTLSMAGAMLWLIMATDLRTLYIFAIFWGFCYGGLGPVVSAWIVDTFGQSHIGTILGILGFGWAIGAALGPALAGYCFDIHGSYNFAFLGGMLALLLTAALILLQETPTAKTGNRIA